MGKQAAKVLCVNDDTFARLSLVNLIGRSHPVDAVRNAEEAAAYLADHGDAVGVVVADMDVCGVGFLDQVREDHPRIVVVLLVGTLHPTVRQEVRRRGLPWIEKPFSSSDLRAKVAAAVEEYWGGDVPLFEGTGDTDAAPRGGRGGPAPVGASIRSGADAYVEALLVRIGGSLQVPSIDPRALELVQGGENAPPELEAIVDVIANDPRLAAQTVQLTNSVGLGGARALTDIQEACTRLGATELMGLVQEVLIRRALRIEGAQGADVARSMWNVARLTAKTSFSTAKSTGDPNPNRAYLAGLLHNIGEIAVLWQASQLSPRFDKPTMERVGRVSAGLHESLGGRILRSWNMPAGLWQVAEVHHRRGPAEPELATLRRLVEASWVAAVDELGAYLPGLPSPLGAAEDSEDAART
jgi:HD-like signal output (HDOD) protein